MKLYRKRPHVVEATQWTGDEAQVKELIAWIKELGGKARYLEDGQFQISMGENVFLWWYTLPLGGYVVREHKGFTVHLGRDFEAEYEMLLVSRND